MSKKTLSLVVGTAVAASLSSCSNLILPDSNHPKVLPVPMYNPNPIPTGAHWAAGTYHIEHKSSEEGHTDHHNAKIGPSVSGHSPTLIDPSRRR